MALRIGLRVCLLSCSIVLVSWTSTDFAKGPVAVSGSTRSNGTYVAPHYRSSPDGDFWNNWSTKGNVNPINGKEGTRVTPPKSQGGAFGGVYSSYLGGSNSIRQQEDSDGALWIDRPNGASIAVVPQSPIQPAGDILRNVAATNYHGVGFSTTEQQFLQAFPHATPIAPNDSVGMVTYAIEDLDGKRDAISFQFLDSQLIHLVFAYGEARIRQYGGTNVLMERAKQKFGTPTREDSASAVWLFPTIDRLVMTERDDSTWYLIVTPISAQQMVNANRAKIDVGF